MGQQLVDIYRQAEEKGGLTAKMRIAMKIAVSSNQAASVPDEPALLQKAKEVLNEF